MKKPRDGENYLFVDESGDPTFYARGGKCIVGEFGCSKVLILFFIESQNPHPIRKAVLTLQEQVLEDPYLTQIASVKRKTAMAFHAKNDPPEVRHLFYKLIEGMDFKAQFIVARKIERVFRERYDCKEQKFYNDLVTQLMERVLHRYSHNEIIFSQRGSAQKRRLLEHAIWRARGRFEKHCGVDKDSTTFKVQAQTPRGDPCLSVIDYMNWAIFRAFLGDARYYEFVRQKISFLQCRFLEELGDGPYSRKHPFDAKKAALLGLGSKERAHGM